MNDTNPETPSVQIEQPESAKVLGELSASELQRLKHLRQQADQMVHQIGVTEVQKQRFLQQLGQIEAATNQVVRTAGKRLSIPDGTAWSVTSDGKAIQVGEPPRMPVQMQAVPDKFEDEPGALSES